MKVIDIIIWLIAIPTGFALLLDTILSLVDVIRGKD